MNAIRYKAKDSTRANLKIILDLIQDAKTTSIHLFASPTEQTVDYSGDSDGPDSNLPLVAAVVVYEIPGVEPLSIVFDGPFLTAVRGPRYSEVRQLLDAAVNSERAYFSETRCPFTSSLSAQGAASLLAALPPVVLTATSRPIYFSLLSTVPEESAL